MKKIIAFIGFEGSGKDYQTAKELKKNKNSSRIGFSDGVRRATFKYCGCSPKYGDEYEEWKITNIPRFNKTGRQMLLLIGEGLRLRDPHVWSTEWLFQATWSPSDVIIVNDCRFTHEALAIIDIAKQFGAEYEFIHCNYQSGRFKVSNDNCDKLAMHFHNNYFGHLKNITKGVEILCEEYRNNIDRE